MAKPQDIRDTIRMAMGMIMMSTYELKGDIV